MAAGFFGLVASSEAIYDASHAGPTGDDFSGLLCIPAGLVLLAKRRGHHRVPRPWGSAEAGALLAREGYGVLVLDRRGEGESEGDANSFGWGGDRGALAMRRAGAGTAATILLCLASLFTFHAIIVGSIGLACLAAAAALAERKRAQSSRGCSRVVRFGPADRRQIPSTDVRSGGRDVPRRTRCSIRPRSSRLGW